MHTFITIASKRELTRLGSSMNELAAAQPSAFALAQMKKMGWTEGKGLGKAEQGRAEHLKVTQRKDNAGLGKPEGEIDWADQWWHRSYDSLNIQIAVSDDGSSDGSSDSSSSDDSSESDSGRATTSMAPTPTTPGSVVPTDEELLRACGGRRLGMRARATQLGKWKRVEGADVVTGKVLNEGVVPVRTPRSTGVPQPAVSAAAAVVGALEAKKKARKQGEQREDGEAASKAEQRAERLRRKLEKELKRQRRQERRERKAQQQAAAADATADARKRKRAARGAPEGGERATAAAGSTVPVSDLHPAGGERAAVRESKKARKRSQTAE